jgi:hypothetical protein
MSGKTASRKILKAVSFATRTASKQQQIASYSSGVLAHTAKILDVA